MKRLYLVERRDKGGWFSVGSYRNRDKAAAHARMIRGYLRRAGQIVRGAVRVRPQST